MEVHQKIADHGNISHWELLDKGKRPMYLQYNHVEAGTNSASPPKDSSPLILSNSHDSLVSIPLFFEVMVSEDEKKEVAECSHKKSRNNKKNYKKNKKKKGGLGAETTLYEDRLLEHKFNSPLSQKEVSKVLKKYSIDIFGVIESKMEENKVDALMRLKFPSWRQCNNFATYQPGIILVLRNPSTLEVSILNVNS